MMTPENPDTESIQKEQIILPEYGRHLQELVDYCLQIEDRDERTACAAAIVKALATLHPDIVGPNRDMSKAWDQIMIMSRFRLDVDFPCEVITEEKLSPKPEKIPYTASSMRFRHYGKHIEKMVRKVADMEDSPEKDLLVSMIAHHMKKLMLTHNKEGVSDAKVLRDLALYSEGRIDLDPETYLLHEFREAAPIKQQNGKKRKKR